MRARSIIEAAKQHYYPVVIDSPPVLHVADPMLIAKHVENILFVVEAGCMVDDMVLEAIHRFADEERAPMRALLTKVRPGNLTHMDYYSGYETLWLK
jgi:Mrp family chromosome partitioning ATPase